MTEQKKVDLVIPKMGESITEATIGKIFKPDGSLIQVDEEILELETDKVNLVLYAPASGTLSLQAKSGDLVKIDQVVGAVVEGSAKTEAPPVEAPSPKPVEEVSAQPAREPAPEPALPPAAPLQATPAGTERTKMSRIRQTIAHKLLEAQNQTAMLTTFNEIDMTEVIRLREEYKESFQKKYGVKLGFMSFFVKAVTAALEEFPLLGSYIEGDEIVRKESLDIGVAVSTDRGLVVPVVRNAGALNSAEIEQSIEELSKKAREGGLTVDDMRGGVFTVTNGGVFGSLLSTPILNFPQSGILGLHKIQKRAVVIEDEIVVRSMMYVALTYDHRVVDGKEAVLFLVRVKNLLEDPARFLVGI